MNPHTPSLRAYEAAKPKPTGDSIILLWMAGGQAAPEVWDMKKHTPFEKGMETKAVPGSVDGKGRAVDSLFA